MIRRTHQQALEHQVSFKKKKKALEHGVSNIEGERGKRRTRREGELEMMMVKAFPLLKLICWQLI